MLNQILPSFSESLVGRKAAMTVRYARRVHKPENGLVHLNIEPTRVCNAWCAFCDCPGEKKGEELGDYVPVVERLKPMIVSFSGGEPTLRKDIVSLIHKVHRYDSKIYLSMTTNGSRLTVDFVKQLRDAGLDAIVVSLDFLDERHDEVRGIQGLTAKIANLMPQIADIGLDRVSVQTILSQGNLDQIIPITLKAKEWGVCVSYNPYCEHKNGNTEYRVRPDSMEKLGEVIDRILEIKKREGHVRSSRYLLTHVIRHFERADIGGCMAGIRWLVCSPDGQIRRCPDFPNEVHYTQWTPNFFKPTSCTQCWYSCRVEAQAPMGVSRWLELFK